MLISGLSLFIFHTKSRRYWPTPHHLGPRGNTVSRIVAWWWHCFVSDIPCRPASKTAYVYSRIGPSLTESELDAFLPELKAAIRDHIRYVRAIVVESVPQAGPQSKTAA